MALHSSPAAFTSRPPVVRLFPLLALATFGALLLAALTALPAAAHSTLLSATPEDGAELEEVPDAVVLTFNENITDLGTDIVVTGPDGADAADGETEIDGPEVSRALPGDLPAGEYTITWRAVSADGHPIDGESTFTVLEGAGSGDEAAGDESASEAGDDASPSESANAPEDDAETGQDDAEAGEDGSEGDQADADASDAGNAEADPGASEDDGTSGGQIALFVVIGLAVIGGVTALIVRMRRQQ